MQFLTFLKLQTRLLVIRWRWLLPLPVMSFIAYLLTNTLKNNQLPGFLPGSANMVNSWDALFITFGNAYYVIFVIANLFLILVCDSLPESGFGQMAVFRLFSRKKWWAAKSLSMLLAAFLYTLICFGLLLCLASIGLSFNFEWSQFANYPPNILLPFFLQKQSSPLEAAGILFGLNVLGFWSLGVLMQVITLLTKRYLYGYLTALLVLVGSLGISGSLVNVLPYLQLLPAVRNLILTFYPFPFREVPLFWSFIYWAIWLLLLNLAGSRISRRQNYLALRH